MAGSLGDGEGHTWLSWGNTHPLTPFLSFPGPDWKCTAKCTTCGSWRVGVTARWVLRAGQPPPSSFSRELTSCPLCSPAGRLDSFHTGPAAPETTAPRGHPASRNGQRLGSNP